MSPLKQKIRAEYKAKPWKTARELAAQFKCHEDTVTSAIRAIRVDDGRTTKAGKNGRAFVPLPEPVFSWTMRDPHEGDFD